MKIFTILTLALISTQTYAGYWTYSCESTDGLVKLTRENLVITQKDSSTGQIDSLIVKPANDTINTGPSVGEQLVYKDSFEAKTENDIAIKFTKSVSEKIVAEDAVNCEEGDSGHGPGYSTEKKILQATLSIYGIDSKKTLVCFETFGYSGTCDFSGRD